MVFFICDACGQSVKKKDVQSHYERQCHNCSKLSCMDCGEDFWGDDYKAHNQCITESEKYGAQTTETETPKKNPTESKQQIWIKHVTRALDGAHNHAKLLPYIDSLKNLGHTVPMKKAKFMNAFKNTCRCHNIEIAEQFWQLFMAEREAQENPPEVVENDKPVKHTEILIKEVQNTKEEKKMSKKELKEQRRKERKRVKSKENVGDENGIREKKKRKRQNSEEEDEIKTKKRKKQKRGTKENKDTQENSAVEEDPPEEKEEPEPTVTLHFDWVATITSILKKNKKGDDMCIKKLKKKVIAEYYAHYEGSDKPMDTLDKKFKQKVTKNKVFRVLKERVKLVPDR